MYVKTVDKLYAVEVVEEEGERVKIHYVGYDDRFDEWRQKEEIKNVSEHGGQQLEIEPYERFDLHQELAYQIKLGLKNSRKDPGLKCCGRFLRKSMGHDIYGLDRYSDLKPLLGNCI